MSKVLVIAEHDGTTLNPSTAKCVACAAAIEGATVDVAVFAAATGDLASQAAAIDGVSRVITISFTSEDPRFAALAANTTAGQGYGGGIWKPGGTALKIVQDSKPSVVVGDIPLR